MAGLRAGAERSVKADLALRALADAEDLQVTDEELDRYFESMAAQTGLKAKQVRDRIDRAAGCPRYAQSSARRRPWPGFSEHVQLVDENGESGRSDGAAGRDGNEGGREATSDAERW